MQNWGVDMSRSGGNRKPLMIDRDALRDARLKAHKHERHGLTGFLLLLALLAAVGAVLWTYHGGAKPLPPHSSAPLTASVQDPLPPPVDPAAAADPAEIPSEPDLTVTTAVTTPIVSTPSILSTHGQPRPTHDHLSPNLLQPSTRKILFQIGRLDGHPENDASPFTGEFGKADVRGSVVRIDAENVREEFPQRIMPGQSIVLKLPEMEAQDLLFRSVSVRMDESGAMLDSNNDEPSLRIRCNGNTIWGRRLDRRGLVINALIPASYLESYKNTITLQNDGNLPVVFDALWLESACTASESVSFAIRDWERIPNDFKGEFGWNRERESEQIPGISLSMDMLLSYPMRRYKADLRQETGTVSRCEGLWRYSNQFVRFNEQEKVVLYFLESAVGWYFHGGSALILENVTGPGRFFCPYTKRLYPSAYALWSLSRVLEGQARRMPVNVLAGDGDEQPLDRVYWMGASNKPGVASIIVAKSRFGTMPGGKVRVVCALPWHGATVATVYNGVFPDVVKMGKPTYRGEYIGDVRHDDPNGVYDRNRVDKRLNIQLAPNGQGGLLDAEWDIQDCLYIRLVQQGATGIESPGTNQAFALNTPQKPAIINVAGGISETRESGLLRRKWLPVYSGSMVELCANYRVRMDKATPGAVQGQDYVVPEDQQSVFCDIDYTGGAPRTAEGAALPLYRFGENIEGKTLSFWVYPHTQTTGKTVTLRMALGAWEGSATLKPGKWQRVELQFADLTGGYERHLVLLGPSDYERPGRSDKITFEFNGIALFDAVGSGGRYMDVRPLADGRQAVVLLGLPGQAGSARHSFPKAVSVNTVTEVGGTGSASTLQWAYKSDSQTLEITGLRFPESTDDSVRPYLNFKEKQHCQKGLTPVVLIAEIDT
jgi:hypothetical protein